MRVAVCDDDRAELDLIVAAINGAHPGIAPDAFTSGAELLSAAKRAPGYDVVFLDIYMGGENGVEIARALRESSTDACVVFVTTSREHAVEAFSLNALHYLVKPITKRAMEEVFARLQAQLTRKRSLLVLQSGQERRSLYQDEVRYIQSADHFTDIMTEDGGVHRVRLSIGELSRQLDRRFLRVQRGVIVNMDYIAQMNAGDCVLRNGIVFSLSRKDRQAIRAAYNNHAFGRLRAKDAQGTEGTP